MKFGEKLKAFFGIKSAEQQEFYDSLADLLIEGDFGASLAMQTVDKLEAACKKEKITVPDEVKAKLSFILKEYLLESGRSPAQAQGRALRGSASAPFPPLRSGNACAPLQSLARTPQPPQGGAGIPFTVILLLGVNGVGKTSTAAKLAFYCMQGGEGAAKPLLAAADTFRAAAIEQLEIHGKRLGVRVVAHKQGGDAAAVVYDALQAAKAGGYNPVIVDTAGRMHTKTALIEELKKIDRIVERFASAASGAATPPGAAAPPAGAPSKAPSAGAPPSSAADSGAEGTPSEGITYLKYLCLDATTGTNALAQAETFNEAVRLDGVILTKLDSTARGGVVFPLAVNLKLPVVFVCNGERCENFSSFNADDFLREFLEE